MQTPKEYANTIKEGIITEKILKLCLFSVNKRAKNWRDAERRYRRYSNYFKRKQEFIEEAKRAKEEMYKMKDILLTVVDPQMIHKEAIGSRENPENCRWYLFYDFGDYSFHSPIEFYELECYAHLPIVELRNFTTTGYEITELLSPQFVRKVVTLVETGNYRYIPEDDL